MNEDNRFLIKTISLIVAAWGWMLLSMIFFSFAVLFLMADIYILSIAFGVSFIICIFIAKARQRELEDEIYHIKE